MNLELSKEQANSLRAMEYASKKDFFLTEFVYNSEVESRYGYIAFIKDDNQVLKREMIYWNDSKCEQSKLFSGVEKID